MVLREAIPSTLLREKQLAKETSCLNRGDGRYFIVHRVSQFAKRNPRKELRKRLKEIDRLSRYAS
ncbi:MAG: hypothetical protein HY282_15920 [Nitrospirae bacterium]|nr:hypothetical protein [Candidatus Manganitrophaceae bacterium]